MPNIERHVNYGSVSPKSAKEEICLALSKVKFSDAFLAEIVISTVQDNTTDLSGEPQPFIRLITTEPSELGLEDHVLLCDVLGELADLEIYFLNKFTPMKVQKVPQKAM